MKRWWLMLVMLMLSGSIGCFAQVALSDAGKMSFKGKVKNVRKTAYFAIIKDGKIQKGDEYNRRDKERELKFDESGKLVNISIGKRYDQEVNDSVVDTFDENGFCVKSLSYYPNGSLKQSTRHIYDESGRLKLSIIRAVDNETVDTISYSYDTFGNLLIKVIKRHNGAVWQERYLYDESGNWITCVEFSNNTPVFYTERDIEYY